MATHSSVLAWRIPGTGEPGGLPSMELHRVGPPPASSREKEVGEGGERLTSQGHNHPLPYPAESEARRFLPGEACPSAWGPGLLHGQSPGGLRGVCGEEAGASSKMTPTESGEKS